MKNRKQRLLMGAFIVAIGAVACCGFIAWIVCERATDFVRDAYAQWWVGDMLVEHLRQREGKWPQRWDDLRAPYDACVRRAGAAPWSFEELRSRVEIDFNADPRLLARAPSPEADGWPFRVVWLRNGKSHCYEGAEPNQMIWEYLTTRETQP